MHDKLGSYIASQVKTKSLHFTQLMLAKISWLGVMQILPVENTYLSLSYQIISHIELTKESGLFRLCKAGMRETDRSE